MAPSSPTDEAAIREQAYYFWEAEGRPHGREYEFWQRAAVAVAEKSQLDTLTKGAPKTGAKPKAAKAAASARQAPGKSMKTTAKSKSKSKKS